MGFSDVVFLQNSFKFEKYPQGGEEDLVVVQAKCKYIFDYSVSSYCNARSRKAYFESELAKILCYITNLIQGAGQVPLGVCKGVRPMMCQILPVSGPV